MDTFDFLEILPDTLWNDRGLGAIARYEENREAQMFLGKVARRKALIAHSIGISIGSSNWFDTALSFSVTSLKSYLQH